MASTTDNAIVVRSLRLRRFIAGSAVLGVLGLALLPSEHVHGQRSGAGRHADIVHRHFQPHHDDHPLADHPVTAGVRGDDHDDDDAQWLTQAFINPKAGSAVHPAAQWLAEELALLHPLKVSRRMVPSTYVSVHDPPWQASNGLRGPPSLLV